MTKIVYIRMLSFGHLPVYNYYSYIMNENESRLRKNIHNVGRCDLTPDLNRRRQEVNITHSNNIFWKEGNFQIV